MTLFIFLPNLPPEDKNMKQTDGGKEEKRKS